MVSSRGQICCGSWGLNAVVDELFLRRSSAEPDTWRRIAVTVRARFRLTENAGAANLPRPPQHHTHGALHRAVADAVQGFLAGLNNRKSAKQKRSRKCGGILRSHPSRHSEFHLRSFDQYEQGFGMIRSRHFGDACFQALVAIPQAFIASVAGVAVAFALWSWGRLGSTLNS